ncbi:MAG TPA: CRISPR-associated endonuclease Cas2 [Firmicutes bacterium]|nr:CRISPR-associated endonuclease Cas2 [Bacillota bacterium]
MRDYFIVSYDICDPKRLRRVHQYVQDFGDPLQYSVFLCSLTSLELAQLREGLRDLINHRDDQVLFIRLGQANEHTLKQAISSMGQAMATRDLNRLIF